MIAIFRSYSPEGAPLARLTAPNVRAYADRHGYDVLESRMPWDDVKRGIRFSRIQHLLAYYEVVMQVDVDALFANPEVAIPDRLVPGRDVVLADEHLGGSPINSGVCIWKQGVGSKWFLEFLRVAAPIYFDNPWIYQQTTLDLLNGQWGEPYKRLAQSIIAIVPAESINSHPVHSPDGVDYPKGIWNYRPGYWIVHFLCGSVDQKCNSVMRFLQTGES